MLDPLTSLALGFLVGAFGGALSAYLGWNASGDPFVAKKFIGAIITGILGGLALVFANLAGFKTVSDDFAVVGLLGTVFMGAVGADYFKEKISTLINNKNESNSTVTPTPISG